MLGGVFFEETYTLLTRLVYRKAYSKEEFW